MSTICTNCGRNLEKIILERPTGTHIQQSLILDNYDGSTMVKYFKENDLDLCCRIVVISYINPIHMHDFHMPQHNLLN